MPAPYGPFSSPVLPIGSARASVPEERVRPALDFTVLSRLPFSYWLVVMIAAAFTIARFSDAFLILKALRSGLPTSVVPLVIVAMNLVYSVISYPAGILSDRYGSRGQLAAGIVLLIVANVVLALSNHLPGLVAGVVLWGAHLGFTQGVLSKMVSSRAPADMMATGFGIFNLVSGIAVLLSSLIAGLLWQQIGMEATFIGGALFAALAGTGMACSWRMVAGTR